MPKTFHMNVAFDVRIVLSDEECAEAEKYREKCLTGTKQGTPDQHVAMATHGQPLDAYIAMTLKHALRDAVADMAEENSGVMTISPAKVIQVIVPRIETNHKAHALAKLQEKDPDKAKEVIVKCPMGCGCRNH